MGWAKFWAIFFKQTHLVTLPSKDESYFGQDLELRAG
jgi:hypothetical protein